MTRVVAAQLGPSIGDLEANRALALAAIRDAVNAGADVVVLPELITSGYMFASAEEAASAAIAADHEILREWAAEAAQADILLAGGFCELGEDGRVYNSAAIFARSPLRSKIAALL